MLMKKKSNKSSVDMKFNAMRQFGIEEMTQYYVTYIHTYRIVASRSTSRLVTCLGLFRLLMKGIFGPYVL